jgi:hypothetical protein
MTTQNYLIVKNNVVTNLVMWDGGSDWTPPTDATMLIQATTPAMIWVLNLNVTPRVFELIQVEGVGNIGFTWDGTVLTTNEPKPV